MKTILLIIPLAACTAAPKPEALATGEYAMTIRLTTNGCPIVPTLVPRMGRGFFCPVGSLDGSTITNGSDPDALDCNAVLDLDDTWSITADVSVASRGTADYDIAGTFMTLDAWGEDTLALGNGQGEDSFGDAVEYNAQLELAGPSSLSGTLIATMTEALDGQSCDEQYSVDGQLNP